MEPKTKVSILRKQEKVKGYINSDSLNWIKKKFITCSYVTKLNNSISHWLIQCLVKKLFGAKSIFGCPN